MSDAERFQVLRPLGADQATFVARDASSTAPRYVVLERVTRASPVPAARAELLRRGRALVALEHPKVVRVREVFERDGEVLVVSDYVDGEWLSTLMMMTPRPPLELMLRLVLDVLEGLSVLHDLRDDRGQSIGFVHGALAPDTVLVAEDGVAEIARACRLPRPGGNERYVAPELRRGDGPIDVRCDIYAAGAILRDVLVDAPADATWAEPLTDIAWRACSVEPDDRWPSAAAMATTVRRIAGAKMSTATAVADLVRRRFGGKMQTRRAALELGEDAPPPSSEPLSVKPSDMEVIAEEPTPAARKEVARVSLVRKPASLVLTEQPPDLPEPETRRRVGTTTQQGMPVVAMPPAQPIASAPALRPQPSAPPVRSLPPPTISVTETEPTPPPPPTIAPEEDDSTHEAYRRRMPTFPTFEPDPPRRSSAMQGMVIAGAMVATFAIGWWVGRHYAPQGEIAQAVCPPAATTAAWGTAAAATAPLGATTATATGTVAAPESATASATGTATAIGTAFVSGTATAVAAATAPPTATATAMVPATTATATVAVTQPTLRPTAATAAAPPRPTASTAAAAPTQTEAPAPKPATSGGYVPSEL
jgi:hypothetical protein